MVRRFVPPDGCNLSRRAAVLVVAGLVVVVGSLAYFGELIEDVTNHDDIVLDDGANLHWFVEHRSAAVVDVSRALNGLFGGPVVLGACAVLVGLALWWTGQRLFVAAAPAASLAAASVMARVVKELVERRRPPEGVRLVAVSESSFPARHVVEATAFVLACALLVAVFALHRRLARALVVGAAVLLTVAVGASRLVLGVHWPSDVIAGTLLGLAIAVATTIGATIIDAASASDLSVRRPGRVWRLVNHRRQPLLRSNP